MMGHREALKGGDEWGVVSKYARQMVCYTSRPGVCKSVKQKMNRRFRKDAKAEIREGDYGY